jgi:ABC-type uncharacterized transport system auxiliary subunit
MKRSEPRCRAAGVLVLTLGIGIGGAGCTGSLFKSKAPPSSAYLLSARLAAATVPPLPFDLAVQRPRVRAGLESDRIAVLYPDRRLDHFADARWSGPLDQVVQDLLLQAFTTGAVLRNVSAESSAFPSGYWLEVMVEDFQAEYPSSGGEPRIHVHMLARLGAGRDRRVLGSFEATALETAGENRLSAIVDAYERAADAALGEIVADTTRTLAKEADRH